MKPDETLMEPGLEFQGLGFGADPRARDHLLAQLSPEVLPEVHGL